MTPVEAVARAIQGTSYRAFSDQEITEMASAAIAAHLASLEAQGMVVVPGSALKQLFRLAQEGASSLRSVGLSAQGTGERIYEELDAGGFNELGPSTESIVGLFNKTA